MARSRLPPVEAERAVWALADEARAGSSWAVGRLLSLTENPVSARVLAATLLSGVRRRAPVVGLTGPPGAGKSSTVSALIHALRERAARVAVLAIDPSSPYSGGALLGDRARMREHAEDPGVFIRSMSSRGRLGGLSRAAPQALQVLEAVGFDLILLETVGVGQSEVDVVRAADTVVVMSAPGMGDDLQAMKAGVLEIADIYLVNKADLPEAQQLVRQLRQTASLAQAGAAAGAWRRPVVTAVATANDVTELVGAIDRHQAFLERTGGFAARRAARTRDVLRGAAVDLVQDWLDGPVGRSSIDRIAERVLAGTVAELVATDEVMTCFCKHFSQGS